MSSSETTLTTSLSRIQYRHVDRTKRDIVDALQAFSDLSVRADVHVFSDVGAKELLCVSGTIPVLYRGSTYNIPIAVWLLDTYPSTPPLVRVDPTSDMRINPGRHVDSNGIIYLPYLHEWNSTKCDLVGLLDILVCVFGEDPPVYSASPMTSLTPTAAASRPSQPVQPAASVRSAATDSWLTHDSPLSAAATSAAASDRASRSALEQPYNSSSATRAVLPSLPVTVSRTPVAATWNSPRVTTARATAAATAASRTPSRSTRQTGGFFTAPSMSTTSVSRAPAATTSNVARVTAAAADAAAAPEPETKTCAVCLETAINRVAFIPCGHACFCRQCGLQLQRCVPPLCPMCRKTIQSILSIYD